ncbi:MAG: metallophosphoesterase family protein [Steroidobacteraceae bacterium]
MLDRERGPGGPRGQKPARESKRDPQPAKEWRDHARHSLELSDRGLRIVVVADTHGRPHPASDERIAAETPDRILHAGDIGELAVLDALEKIAPVLAVRGNIDAPVPDVPDALTLDVVGGGRCLIRLLVVHIAVNGPKLRSNVRALARAEQASLVICGHSHVPFIGRDQGLHVFNPGSIGPRRFQLPIVFGVIEIDRERRLSMRHVDCETGRVWVP